MGTLPLGVNIPLWGYLPALTRARDEGATLLWGARAIAKGLDIPWDRQGWAGYDGRALGSEKVYRKLFAERFLDTALVKARAQAPLLREDEIVEVARMGDGEMYPYGAGWECVLVARKAGGYVYLTAARVPTGTDLLGAP